MRAQRMYRNRSYSEGAFQTETKSTSNSHNLAVEQQTERRRMRRKHTQGQAHIEDYVRTIKLSLW